MQFSEKFIAYIDILGFKGLVARAEAGEEMSLPELLSICSKLGTVEEHTRLADRGRCVCPQSSCLRPDLDFVGTQISDCVVLSSEISPAGVIHLVNRSWVIVVQLLEIGIMCRGFLTSGRIYHTPNQFIGSGYQKALEGEPNVTFQGREAGDRGTPFVEIDRSVVSYVADSCDGCVQEIFRRSVLQDGELCALFPFKPFGHQFTVTGLGRPFDAAKEKKCNENVRTMIAKFKRGIATFVDPANLRAVAKATHYLNCLDVQLIACDRTYSFLAAMESRGELPDA